MPTPSEKRSKKKAHTVFTYSPIASVDKFELTARFSAKTNKAHVDASPTSILRKARELE